MSKISNEILQNYSLIDNYRNNTYGVNAFSQSEDSKLYEIFQKLNENYRGEKIFKIFDSLYTNNNRPDKIYTEFEDYARRLNREYNFDSYFASLVSIAEKHANNPISIMAILDLYDNEFNKKRDVITSLSKRIRGRAKKSDYYDRLMLRLDKSIEPLMIGKLFTSPYGKTPEMKNFTFNASSGSYTLVEFWTSSCKPCRLSNPDLNAILNKYQDKGFQILGVSLDGEADRWKKAIHDDKIEKWIHVADLNDDGFTGRNTLKYKISEIPVNVLIDSRGSIIFKNVDHTKLPDLLDTLYGKNNKYKSTRQNDI